MVDQIDIEAGQIQQFLDFLISQLRSRQNFELVQSYMHLFLKVHGDVIVRHPLSTCVNLHGLVLEGARRCDCTINPLWDPVALPGLPRLFLLR